MGSALSISIVIPTLNAGRTFGTVLHRIMGQGRTPLEILIADSGSTDGTRHIVEQFPAARFVELNEPVGPKTWNRAMLEARGEVVVFLAQDALPANGDWLSHLTAPFEDPSVAGCYGRQEASIESDPISGFRLGQRYCREPHWRRARIGDPIRYKSLPFFIDNAAVRRSVWNGIHFNEHLPLGADRVWARQVLLESCTIAYAPDAAVAKEVRADLKIAFDMAMLTGYTDRHFGDAGGTLWPDSRRFAKRAAWYLLKGFAWGQLPYLALEDAATRYGYRLGCRLQGGGPWLGRKVVPETVRDRSEPPGEDLGRAA